METIIQIDLNPQLFRLVGQLRFAAPAKKIARTEGVSFLRFQNWVRGHGVGVYRFSGSARREKFAFVFSMRLAGRSIGGERLGRFGFICVPAASPGHGVERAADPLHRAWINVVAAAIKSACSGGR
jgi:hypothetical protein